jgi:hypothetical protein
MERRPFWRDISQWQKQFMAIHETTRSQNQCENHDYAKAHFL